MKDDWLQNFKNLTSNATKKIIKNVFLEPNLFTAESAFLSRHRHRLVIVPSLGVLNGLTSLTVLNRPLALFVLRTLKDG